MTTAILWKIKLTFHRIIVCLFFSNVEENFDKTYCYITCIKLYATFLKISFEFKINFRLKYSYSSNLVETQFMEIWQNINKNIDEKV